MAYYESSHNSTPVDVALALWQWAHVETPCSGDLPPIY